MPRKSGTGMYGRIYRVVRSIPPGKVMTYGQVAGKAGGCSARNVGYAMAALPFDSDVPWQRVINAKGEVSRRLDGTGHLVQRQVLEIEGVRFSKNGKVDLSDYGWNC
jgi:methylated-DNA-protein-cysteine methyltransferase-like protein